MDPSIRAVLTSVPAWLVVAILFTIFLGISLGSRALVRHKTSDARRQELASHASTLVTGTAASFAFFVGFAITMMWGAVSAGQTAVENQAAHAQQLVWTVQNISDEPESERILAQLQTYLQAAANADGLQLAAGETTDLPSGVPLDTLQNSIHHYAFGPNSSDPEVAALVATAADVSESAAAVAAISNRALPSLVVVLLLTTASLLAVVMGISNATMERPILLPIWCLIAALAITVIPGPGSIGIDLSSLQVVADRIGG